MASPALKNKAASIWSFDSGYGSSALEEDDNFQVDFPTESSSADPNLGAGFWNIQVEDQQLRLTRSESPIQPVTTKLNVFTTKVGSSSNTDFSFPLVSQEECVTCQLWDITNPGENLKCDECTGKESVGLEVVSPVTPELDGGLAVLRRDTPSASKSEHRSKHDGKFAVPRRDTPSASRSKHASQPEGKGRCSACEISALIDPTHSSTCASCTPYPNLLSLVAPPPSSKVKRSSARRPPSKLESHALRCLQNWLRENQNNPYPDTDTKRSLAQRCGITEKQVTTWFTNVRARRRLVNPTGHSNPASEDEGDHQSRLSSVASTSRIDNNTLSSYATPDDLCYSDVPQTANSNFGQPGPITSRRGKKKDYGQMIRVPPVAPQSSSIPPTPVSASTTNISSETGTWQCTFCYQPVAPKSWRRHEETQHRPKRKWTCLHTGPSITLPSIPATPAVCVFCTLPNPSDDHFRSSHRIIECMNKSADERTFLRPDHLRQHVKNFHKSALRDVVRDTWRREGAGTHVTETWICGFCAQTLTTWDKRETHIAGHFKDGLTMLDWRIDTQEQDLVQGSQNPRPSSSQGPSNVFTKLARSLTARSTTRPQQQHIDSQFANAWDSIPLPPDNPTTSDDNISPLPDMGFDSFMADVCGNPFEYSEPNASHLNEQGCYDQLVPSFTTDGDVDMGVEFGALTGGTLFLEDAEFSGGWY
ncbi:hypothetical protein BDW02DRAFT_631203 [Decorospora gaudefroyi]|uniref:Homeobox domain-containing protein n=1 Tax=Decorospora gaudefroyi TaxID=184978 RepID=A0A6A5KB18_9PLEO|nr:hypothetical protein BDW02DRAFT_631203 [Decorospora gaudefroyi]